MTKPIDARRHAVADYATAAIFMAAALYYRGRHRQASALAWANAISILTLSMFTDYPGGLFRRLNFQTHGIVDRVLTVTAAAGPALMGFAKDREALTFYGSAAAEAGVIAATDFSSAATMR
jgi:hypothetical protein